MFGLIDVVYFFIPLIIQFHLVQARIGSRMPELQMMEEINCRYIVYILLNVSCVYTKQLMPVMAL